MEKFMTWKAIKDLEELLIVGNKQRFCERQFPNVLAKIKRNETGKVSLIDIEWQDLTDRFYGTHIEDSKKLANTEIIVCIVMKVGTEADGYEYSPEDEIRGILSVSKTTRRMFEGCWSRKVIFLIDDVTMFIWRDLKKERFAKRRLLTEDVIISIDNAFVMKYKDTFDLKFPVSNTQEAIKTLADDNILYFRDINSVYEEWESDKRYVLDNKQDKDA